MSEDRFRLPDFFILWVSRNWSTLENNGELVANFDIRGVELTGWKQE